MIKNDLLREAHEKIHYTPAQIREYARCRQDIFYFAEKYYKTRNATSGGIDNIKLYAYQKKILSYFVNPPKGKQNIIIMQPRQSGKTTVVSLYILHFLLFNADKTAMILAQVERTALEIMEKIKKAYELLPKWLQQGVCLDGWNKKSIKLENGCRAFCSSTSGVSSAGFTIDLLYLDEFALISDNMSRSFWASVYPTVAAVPNSKIVITSTPRGLNLFHDIWKKATSGQNNFFAYRVQWNEPPADGGRRRDEEWLAEQYATLGHQHVQSEFLCNFIGSSNTLVDASRLERTLPKNPIHSYYNGLMSVYEHPRRGAKYIIGVDPATGTGNDFSAVQVLRYEAINRVYQVATYRYDAIAPYDFAKVVIAISTLYNNCPIMAERNNGCGEVFCNALYYDYECERLINCEKGGLGVLSTSKTKFSACMTLRKYFDNGWVELNDTTTISELSRYEEIKTNIFSGPESDHDDMVTSLYWALYYFTIPEFDGEVSEKNVIEDEYKIKVSDEHRIETDEDNEPPVFGSSSDINPYQNYFNGSGMYNL